MQYALVVTKGKNRELYKMYDNIEQAERKLKKSFKENGVVIKVPEVKSGFRIYKNNFYYMTIVNESKNILFLNNTDNPMELDDCILKLNIDKYFYLEIFNGEIEEYDEKFIDNCIVDDFGCDFQEENSNNYNE
jgi:hypothetical protein